MDQKPSCPMISLTVLFPAAIPPPSSRMTGRRSGDPRGSEVRFNSSNICRSVKNLCGSALKTRLVCGKENLSGQLLAITGNEDEF